MNSWCKQGEMIKASLSKLECLVLLVARLSLGYVFLMAGYSKFGKLEKVAGYFTSISIPYADFHAPLVAGVELVAGGLLILGLMTRTASSLLLIIMCVALCAAHPEHMASLATLFESTVYLYMVILAVLMTRGAGYLSVDAFVCKKSC